jgi:hypothetical protein
MKQEIMTFGVYLYSDMKKMERSVNAMIEDGWRVKQISSGGRFAFVYLFEREDTQKS